MPENELIAKSKLPHAAITFFGKGCIGDDSLGLVTGSGYFAGSTNMEKRGFKYRITFEDRSFRSLLSESA
jgi:hypothetical protein